MRAVPETTLEDIVPARHRRADICCCIPTFGMVPIEFLMGMTRLQMPVNGQTRMLMLKGWEVGAARNQFVIDAMKMKPRPEFLFFYGDDMIPGWEALIKLHEEMQRGGWDMLTGLYYWKGDPPTPLTWRDDRVGRLLPGRDYELGEVIWVDITGLDFTLLRMSTLERMTEPYFQTGPGFEKETEPPEPVSADPKHHGNGNGDHGAKQFSLEAWEQKTRQAFYEKYLVPPNNKQVLTYTEDVFFCRKLREVGGKIGVHTGVRVGHLDIKTGGIY